MVKVVFIISKVGKTKATGITIDYLENMTSFINIFNRIIIVEKIPFEAY